MSRTKGFTILELMVVVAIAAVLSAVAIPNVIAWRNGAQINAAAREALSVVQLTRSRAIKESATAVVEFTAGQGAAYTAFVDVDESGSWNAGDRLIKQGQLPGNVTVGAYQSFSFTSRGIALGSGSLSLTGAGKSLNVAVNLAGGVHIG